MTISIIAAISENNAIGKDNKLPWHLPADLKHFKSLTIGHHIIMGRKTFESIGKPLPGRTTIIITRKTGYKADGCIIVSSIENAISAVKNDSECFIIGGAEIFNQTVPLADKIYLTRIHQHIEGDTFFPDIAPGLWNKISEERNNPDEKNEYDYSFITYSKKISVNLFEI